MSDELERYNNMLLFGTPLTNKELTKAAPALLGVAVLTVATIFALSLFARK